MKKRHKKRAAKANKKALREKQTNKIIFACILIIVFLIAVKIIEEQQTYPDKRLRQDAEKLLTAITTSSLRIIDSNQVDVEKIEEMTKIDYLTLKNELGIKSDFCIHFEDDEGNVIKINGMGVGIGSPKIKVNGFACG